MSSYYRFGLEPFQAAKSSITVHDPSYYNRGVLKPPKSSMIHEKPASTIRTTPYKTDDMFGNKTVQQSMPIPINPNEYNKGMLKSHIVIREKPPVVKYSDTLIDPLIVKSQPVAIPNPSAEMDTITHDLASLVIVEYGEHGIRAMKENNWNELSRMVRESNLIDDMTNADKIKKFALDQKVKIGNGATPVLVNWGLDFARIYDALNSGALSFKGFYGSSLNTTLNSTWGSDLGSKLPSVSDVDSTSAEFFEDFTNGNISRNGNRYAYKAVDKGNKTEGKYNKAVDKGNKAVDKGDKGDDEKKIKEKELEDTNAVNQLIHNLVSESVENAVAKISNEEKPEDLDYEGDAKTTVGENLPYVTENEIELNMMNAANIEYTYKELLEERGALGYEDIKRIALLYGITPGVVKIRYGANKKQDYLAAIAGADEVINFIINHNKLTEVIFDIFVAAGSIESIRNTDVYIKYKERMEVSSVQIRNLVESEPRLSAPVADEEKSEERSAVQIGEGRSRKKQVGGGKLHGYCNRSYRKKN